MKDPRESMLTDLDVSSCRVVHTDSPIVLLCGGLVTTKERHDDPDPKIESLRHAITQTYPAFEVFRPEEITTWHEDAVFKNLVDFETELAAICSLVVIILESSGSIAELGAFSQLDELREKLLVIESSDFNEGKNRDSFINLGILRYLKETNKESVKIFPWNVESPHEIDKETIVDVVNGISDSLAKIKETQLLKITKESHATTLVCELIRIFVALKNIEIVKYASILGFELSADQVHKKLFLLENFQLVNSVEYDGAKYYLRTKSKYNKLRLSSAVGERLEDVKVIIDCMAYYDRHRLGAIKHFNREKAQ
jgi:hypothetical protein